MRRALIIGINDYNFGHLNGCVEDANRMHHMLSTNEDENNPFNFECSLLTSDQDEKITKPLLSEAIEHLLDDDTGTIEVALLYFAGHGYENNLDGYLVTPDASKYNEGYRMADLMKLVKQSMVQEVVIILDCCHSGHLGNFEKLSPRLAELRQGVSILTSSSPSQASLEKNGKGLFTSILCDALSGSAADVLGNITVASVYNYADKILGAFDQRPIFKAHISHMMRLRKTKPKVGIPQILRLTAYFKQADDHFSLDPSYEPTEGPEDKEHEEIFGQLQKLTAAGLVVPVGEEHMYFAAINSKACALTPLGKYYWRLVHKGTLQKLL